MDFENSQKVKDLLEKITNFMNENVYENEDVLITHSFVTFASGAISDRCRSF